MSKEEKLKQALNEVLEVEAEYFDMEELSNTQKGNVVSKIIKIIKEKEGSSNDTE